MREENIFSDNYKCPAAYHVELGLGYAYYPVYNMFIEILLDFHHLPHQFLLNICTTDKNHYVLVFTVLDVIFVVADTLKHIETACKLHYGHYLLVNVCGLHLNFTS